MPVSHNMLLWFERAGPISTQPGQQLDRQPADRSPELKAPAAAHGTTRSPAPTSFASLTFDMLTTLAPEVEMAFVHKIRQVQLIGPKIRKMRKERKLTQTDLASRIGIQQSDLSRMEKGEYRVSLDTLFRILAEFNVSISEFFDDVNKEALTPKDVKIVRDLKQLPSDARREVEAFIAFKRSQNGQDEDDLAEAGG